MALLLITKKFNDRDHSVALRRMNACLGLDEFQAKRKRCQEDHFCILGSMVKKHGAEEGVVIELLRFHRLQVLHLTASSASDLR